MRQYVIIANKGAGSFSQKRLDETSSKIRAAGFSVEQKFCDDFAEISFAADVISRSSDSPIVIAAGGDGTINAVLNGLTGNSATCAILPMGTANVMAIELGIKSADQAVSGILSGQPQPFTAGLIKNSGRSSRFFLMAGAGFDGQIVRAVSLKEKRLIGKGAYLLAAIRSMISWDSGELQVTTDSEEFSCNSLIVCNAAHYGGSFSVAPSANIFSPTFELIAIKNNSRGTAIRTLADIAFCNCSSERLHRTTASRIRIDGIKAVQADGDDWGDSPVEIIAEPDYAKIIY